MIGLIKSRVLGTHASPSLLDVGGVGGWVSGT